MYAPSHLPSPAALYYDLQRTLSTKTTVPAADRAVRQVVASSFHRRESALPCLSWGKVIRTETRRPTDVVRPRGRRRLVVMIPASSCVRVSEAVEVGEWLAVGVAKWRAGARTAEGVVADDVASEQSM
jgi:hypothetical protein